MSESEVQTLRTEFPGLETRLTERFERTEKHVDGQFKQMLDQLKEMKSFSKGTDKLLRGNKGNIGMNDRWNHAEKLQKLFLGGRITLTGFFTILAVFVAKYLDLVDPLRNVTSAG